MLSYFALIYILPSLTLKLAGRRVLAAQIADIVACVLFSALLLRIGRRWTGRADWSLRHTLALSSGVLAFSMLLTVVIPAFWPSLELFATVPLVVLLIALDRRLRLREGADGGVSSLRL